MIRIRPRFSPRASTIVKASQVLRCRRVRDWPLRRRNAYPGAELARYWIHLDADILDGALMPAVDSPEPDGLTYGELAALLKELLVSGFARRGRAGEYDLRSRSGSGWFPGRPLHGRYRGRFRGSHRLRRRLSRPRYQDTGGSVLGAAQRRLKRRRCAVPWSKSSLQAGLSTYVADLLPFVLRR